MNYVLLHITVIIVVITILGGYLYSFFYNTAFSDFQLVNNQYVSAMESRHENDLQIVEDIVQQMSLTDEVRRFKLGRQPDKAMKLEEYLKRYTMVSQFFTVLLYQFHDDHFMYSQSSSIDTDDFLERECILEKTSPEDF